MAMAIPIWLLPSEVAVRRPVDGDFSGEYEEQPTTISNVRFDRAEALARRDWVLEEGAQGVLYVDAVNSGGAFEIPAGSLLSIDGGEWATASKVTPYRIEADVHHWEVEVR
ncbi:hypothetical protein AAY81_03955 [Denitrobacterium detoxificans]|nr:hypothetical protein AAY81_03955 [Denitrobacterium detoxificans]